MTKPDARPADGVAATGIQGLDEILGGGLPRDRLYVLQGDPGVGKTTLALQWLLQGASAGEWCLYITLSETKDETRSVARAHGVIDSLNGYLHAMPEEQFLTLQLHELLMYLGQMGAVTMMVVAQHGLVGAMQSPIDVSYLADAVILFRHFEADGRLHKAISVLKKRTGGHESMIRELVISANGILVGKALENFRGVMTGVPSPVRLSEEAE